MGPGFGAGLAVDHVDFFPDVVSVHAGYIG